jgi:hypothetical protein
VSALGLRSPHLHADERAAASGASEADADKAQAAARFDRGLTLFNEGDNAGALAEFKQTYALMPNPIVLYNIGLVYAAMGRPVDAVDALTAVVDSVALSAEQRERAQKTLSEQRDRVGRVSVTTQPQGARIDVDGVEVAQTPLGAPLRVAAGSHVIGAVAEGYAPAHKEIIVAGNAEATVNFQLVLGSAKLPANLTIHSRIADAQVVLDDQLIGKTPLATSVSVPAGVHRVELSRPGYKTAKQSVELGEGATGEVTLELAVDPAALAADGADFSLDLHDRNANLTLDDEPIGLYTRASRLPKGRHHLRIEVAGYLPFEQDVLLEAGKPNVLTPFLLPTPETRQAHDSNVRWHRVWGIIGVGAGAAIAGTGVALVAIGGSHKTSAQRDFDAANAVVVAGQNKMGDAPCRLGQLGYDPALCVAPRDAAQSRLDRANTERNLGFAGIGVGAAVLGTGIVLLFTGESPQRFDPPKSQGARGSGPSLALAPGPGQFGLGLSGAF